MILVLNRFSGRFNFHQFGLQLILSVILEDPAEAQVVRNAGSLELAPGEDRRLRRHHRLVMALLLSGAEHLAVVLWDFTMLARGLGGE